MPEPNNIPVVMVFAGCDPTGGAGISADIEALAAFGVRAAPIITAVTAQDTAGLKQFTAVETELVIAQARAVLEDMPIAAFKTGMLGNTANLAAIATIMDDYPDIPLILDPVLTTGAGASLSDDALEDVYRMLLIPRAWLVTPNSLEARALASEADELDACGHELMSLGAQHILITGTHEASTEIHHRLYSGHRLLETFKQERLPYNYHGSGCTLASACAAGIAQGLAPTAAVAEGLAFTHAALKAGSRVGMGQLLPDRLFWAREKS